MRPTNVHCHKIQAGSVLCLLVALFGQTLLLSPYNLDLMKVCTVAEQLVEHLTECC